MFEFDKAKFDGFSQSFKEELEKYEMKSLVARLFKEPIAVRKPSSAKAPAGKKKKEDPKDQIGMF